MLHGRPLLVRTNVEGCEGGQACRLLVVFMYIPRPCMVSMSQRGPQLLVVWSMQRLTYNAQNHASA